MPKKHCDTLDDGTQAFTPDCGRPLDVANTDNRLLANAVRLRVERFVGKQVSHSQRGFLPGRSMLAHLVDTDEYMRTAAYEAPAVGAVFFDFAAAFPSLSTSTCGS